ncbi:MAG TPA: acetate/propionate family kinase [Puia sp.]|jgi:acetate kinase|nr:acetate/propionate family kinase [Puia sp.]
MGGDKKNILCVNVGSSSIKFSVFGTDGGELKDRLRGKVDRIGLSGTVLTFKDISAGEEGRLAVEGAGMEGAANFLLDWLEKKTGKSEISGIGHRVVHGASRRQPAIIDDELVEELERISGYDPDHLPGEIGLIRLFRDRDRGLRQVACFDTAFHATLPTVARLMPLPRRYERAGLQRYGFHGLSYTYLLEELIRIAGPEIAEGRVIMAHLGSGASLAAVKGGQSIDTTMGFTPAGGIMMGTRSGDLDPGVIWWILQQEGLGAAQLSDLVNHQSGLKGVSGISSDMQDLLARESGAAEAAEAVRMFCYQVKKAIGAFAAALGGVDAVVFSGGIGERSAAIRSRICTGMEFLGIALDQRANEENELLISRAGAGAGGAGMGEAPSVGGGMAEAPAGGAVRVYVIPTDEEKVIAQQTLKLLNV